MTNGDIEIENPRIYEVGFLLAPSLTEEKVSEAVASLKSVLQDSAVIAEEHPKLRQLAYTIEKAWQGRNYKYDSAYFGWIKFEAPATILPILTEYLDKEENVVRYLLTKTVRESTLVPSKLIHAIRTDDGKEPKEVKREKVEVVGPKMTTEELDKTIEELVVE